MHIIWKIAFLSFICYKHLYVSKHWITSMISKGYILVPFNNLSNLFNKFLSVGYIAVTIHYYKQHQNECGLYTECI